MSCAWSGLIRLMKKRCKSLSKDKLVLKVGIKNELWNWLLDQSKLIFLYYFVRLLLAALCKFKKFPLINTCRSNHSMRKR